ncbi:hypothetical protein [Cupriavidus pampae]|uniref:Uncharacterized protein n=1 Tax=Cupriavidus pampae TaxID=659251 RepID=A0ABN7ZID7_9BURK|nr:hypothetical protein [Cupriavidus pampae]CAG9183869.1 hypothetical protein LMG32289_05448 [Cupriavidus pampae]
MLKPPYLAALALTVAGLSTTVVAVTPPAGETATPVAMSLAQTAEVKVELLRGDASWMQGHWLPRDLKDGQIGPFQFATTRSIPAAVACTDTKGHVELRNEPVEVGTHFAIEPQSVTADGFIVRVKLSDTKLKQIRHFQSGNCSADLIDTEGQAMETDVLLRYGETTEVPVRPGPQPALVRLTVSQPIALTK